METSREPDGPKARRMFEGTGPFLWLALGALVVAVVLAIGIATSQGGLLWTGRAVHAQERGGIAYYSYKGHSYDLDVAGSLSSGPITVYVDPSNPSRAILSSTVGRVSDIIFVVGPLAFSVFFASIALLRRRRLRRNQALASSLNDGFGYGFSQETIDRLRANQKKDQNDDWVWRRD